LIVCGRDSGWLLDSVARRFGLPVGTAPKLVEGSRMVLGRYAIPDVGVWAFERRPGETSPVIEGEAAYYVFRVDSLTPEGVPPLSEVRGQVVYQARIAKKAALWRERAEQIVAALQSAPSLLDAARARGLPAERLGAFTRLRPPPILQLEPKVVGAAFGLRVGERSGALVGEHRAFLLESLARKLADSTAWLAQRDAQRESLMQAARQARVDAYLDGLRKRAMVVDRRKEIFRPQDATAGS
jgi:parvulin-like peptidyl-prolyl isomerase